MTEFILAQIFGGVALILVCIGYFFNTKTKFMIIQIVANIFYAAAFFVVGAYVGAGITAISTVRCVYLYFCEKKSFKYTLHFIPLFILAYIATTIIFWESVYGFLPLISSTLFTIGFAIKNLQLMRYILIVPNVILVLYNILSKTYVSAILDLIEVVVIIVAIIKYANKNKVISNSQKIENIKNK